MVFLGWKYFDKNKQFINNGTKTALSFSFYVLITMGIQSMSFKGAEILFFVGAITRSHDF